MKIAITGSSSNFGKCLSNFLKTKNCKIININKENNFFLERSEKYKFKEKKIDILIHLAHSYTSKGYEVNYKGTTNLFKTAKQHKIKKLIFVSSISSMSNALSLYGKTKFKIEQYCLKNNIIIIRPGLIFGNFVDKKINLISNIIKYLPFLIYFYHPRKYIHSVNIDELCESIYKIILKKYKYKILNIHSKKKVYFLDILNLLTNKPKIRLPYLFFYLFFVFISKLIYLKSLDSFLGIMKSRNISKRKFEIDITTKKTIV